MKVLIINPPFYRLQSASLIHYPPGCCYVAAILEGMGIDAPVYNADYDPTRKTILGNTNHINVRALIEQHTTYERRLHDPQDPLWGEIRSVLVQHRPEYLIISVFSTTLTAGNRIAAMAKELNPDVKTIFEGCFNRGLHCAIDPAANGDFSMMDFALRREPEETVAELFAAFRAGQTDFSAIRGLSWKNAAGEVVHNEDRPFLENLDELPFPARHKLINFESTPPTCFQGIYGSRGCPFDCVFCGCHTSMGYKPRTRSAEDMVEEMEAVYRRHGTRYFYICDDIFFIKKDRAQRFCELLINKRLPIYFSGQTRAEMADDETLALYKRAGGQHIAVGVEVGSPEIRQLIRKGNTVEDVRACAAKIRRAGLRMVAFCMVGLPWETEADIMATVNLVKEISPYIVFAYLPTPAAGTELAEVLQAKNPSGFEAFRDRCHIDPQVGFSEKMDQNERRRLLEWALDEFVKLNKKSLVRDVLTRPGFYWAMAHDLGFFKHPGFLWAYLKDYLRVES